MIRIFYGDDRVTARREINKILGRDYEVFEGENMEVHDMDSVFWGSSLFADTRKILVKDLGEKKECFACLPKYIASLHEVVIWESKLDKRSSAYKDLVKLKVVMQEFKIPEMLDPKQVFEVFEAAWRGSATKAVELCERIEATNDSYRFFGLMTSQAIRKLNMNMDGAKAMTVLKVLADYDIKIKSTGIEPWTLIKSCLIKLSSL